MRGFTSVLHRMAIATFAFGLTFGIPNGVRAQTPQLQPAHLPWQTPALFTGAAPYDNGWTRVLSDAQQLVRRFAAPYQFMDVLTVDGSAQTDTSETLWVPNIRTYVSPTSKPPSTDVGAIRAAMAPVEFTSGVAAESRTMEGVLAGVQFELVD